MRLPPRALAFSLALACTALAAAQPGPFGNAPEVRLELHDGKTSFLLGEPIHLDLVFRNPTSELFRLNTTNYEDIVERVEITPGAGWLKWRDGSGSDLFDDAQLGETEVRIPIELSEGFIFREAGHYEIRITTSRLSRGKAVSADLTGIWPHLTPYPPVTTNTVGLDLAIMPPELEAARVRALTSEMASAGTGSDAGTKAYGKALDQLIWLGGDDALRAKIKLLLNEDENDQFRGVMTQALATTRNLPLQLALLEAAWRDPRQEPLYDMPSALAETHILLRGHGLLSWHEKDQPEHAEEAKIAAKEHAADMQMLIDSLPARSGENRAFAAYLLMEDHSLTPAQLAVVKPVALQEFPRMDALERGMLLETAWPEMHDASLAPALRAMLDEHLEDEEEDALRRLVEVDPTSARPYVIRAICDNTKKNLPLDVVADLPDGTLPEVDACLGAMLRLGLAKGHEFGWQNKALLAGRFATAAILPALREGWKNPAQDGPGLALLLRYQPQEALARLQATPNFSQFYVIEEVFKARHMPFPPAVLDWLRLQVKSEPAVEAVGNAASVLARNGSPEDLAPIEQRLAELRAQSAENPNAEEIKLELYLMGTLLGRAIWHLDDSQKERLIEGCMSAQCRANWPVNQPSR